MSQVRSTQLPGLRFGPNALSSKPKLAAQLAVIVDAWSAAEGYACVLLALLMPGKAGNDAEAWAVRLHTAAAILGRIHNFRLKLDVIRAAAKVALADPSQARALEILRKCLDDAGKAEGERNKIAHKAFGICSKYKDALLGAEYDEMNICMLMSGLRGWSDNPEEFQCQIFTSKYLDEIRNRIVMVNRDMRRLSLILLVMREDEKVDPSRIDALDRTLAEVTDRRDLQNTPKETE